VDPLIRNLKLKQKYQMERWRIQQEYLAEKIKEVTAEHEFKMMKSKLDIVTKKLDGAERAYFTGIGKIPKFKIKMNVKHKSETTTSTTE